MSGPRVAGAAAPALFEPFPAGETAPAREERILAFWDEHDVFRESMRRDDPDAENFVFYEGPPTANAHPGVHHAAARIVKDLFCRFQTMRGKRVIRKGGWDCHGLPVELEVEKALGLASKGEVESYGVAAFNARCRERVTTFADEWTRLSRRIGFWTDMDDPYMTYAPEYVESVWWILANLFDRGLVYEGHKVVPYCPRCETSLSSHEVSQGYKDVQDPSVFVRFRERGGSGRSFLVWTTTPWTLVSNVALAVHPEIEYLRVSHGGEELWIAEPRAAAALTGEWSVLEKRRGTELAGLRYEPLFPYADAGESAYRIVVAEFVSTEDGTGIVHMAPAFGEDDARVGRREGLPTLQPVDASGRFTPDVTPWAGRFVKEADSDILRDLKTRGLLYKRDTILHSYPHCWRCETPLLYYAKKSWFLKTTALQEKLVAENETIDWHPPEIGAGRFGEWLAGNVDWNLSRERYWGTPLPIWRCASCGPPADLCVGSIEDLRRKSGKPLPDFDPHKPFVDEVVFPCSRCGGEMRRVPHVIDAWFDSGAMPFAQWHYPFDGSSLIEEGAPGAGVAWSRRRQFPADFISEGQDQTRGWFYSLLAISTLFKEESSYRRCVVIGLVQDEEGKKMSKSKGNVIDPWTVLGSEGADALRWYLLWSSPPWISKRFSVPGVAEVGRKYLGTLENLYAFFSLYAGIDGYDPRTHAAYPESRTYLDHWILARLDRATREVVSSLSAYDATSAARALQGFVIEDLSNWYLRRSRDRFWAEGMPPDKVSAYDTLYACLARVAHLAAPMTPFFAEELYRRLVTPVRPEAPVSVHLTLMPTGEESPAADRGGTGAAPESESEIEAEMEVARRIVALGRAARNERNIKIRQPLGRAWVAVAAPPTPGWFDRTEEIVRDELNLKTIEPVGENELRPRLKLSVRLRFDKFGSRLGKKAKAFAATIQSLPEASLWDLARKALSSVVVDGEEIALQGDEAEVKREAVSPDEVYAEEGGVGILLDTRLTDDLRDEGFVREVINKVQYMRKEADFQVTDRVSIDLDTPSDRLRGALEKLRGRLQEETLATAFSFGPARGEIVRAWEINGESAEIGISRVAPAP